MELITNNTLNANTVTEYAVEATSLYIVNEN